MHFILIQFCCLFFVIILGNSALKARYKGAVMADVFQRLYALFKMESLKMEAICLCLKTLFKSLLSSHKMDEKLCSIVEKKQE